MIFAQNILPEKVKVLVFSECILFVDGLRQIYNGKSSFSIVRTLNTERNLLESAKIIRPEIIVLEVSRFSSLVIEQIKQLKQSDFSGKLLLLLNPAEISANISSMLSSGVDGYTSRNSGHDDMTNALTVVSSGGLYYPKLSADDVAKHTQLNTEDIPLELNPTKKFQAEASADVNLSDREEVVLRKMAMGLCMKQIASDINLSSKTVDTYRSRAMKKLNLVDRHAVVKHAIRSGWLSEL
ncbi:MAG: response regulator transcription factor [Lentilitoribacter sp.]